MDSGFGNWPTIHALRNASRVAFVDASTGATTTFRELESRTNALADALTQKGVRKGDRVSLVTLNSPQMMEVFFAVAKLGAVTVPINFRLAAPEIQYILKDSGASLVFYSPAFRETVKQASAETCVRELVEVPDAAQRASGGPSAFEDLVTSGDTARVVRTVTHDDLCVLMYTSGTTGFPKGVMLTHGNFMWNAIHNTVFGDGVGRGDVSLAAAPLFHIGALGIHTLPLIYLGGTTVILEAFTPDAWVDAVEKHRVTQAFAVPAMWAAIVNAPGVGERDLTSLRFTISGGAPCPIVVIEAMQRLGVAFTEGFGMTETSPIAAYLEADAVIDHAGSIGRPVHHVEFRVVSEDDQEVGTGQVGELVVRGPNIFVGYWEMPEASREALRGGWFHTGDLARVDEEGYYTLVDRKTDMVITGGENVYPVEVEQVLYRHPSVDEVAVIGLPDEKWGERVVAVVVSRGKEKVTGEELISWARERLAHFKCPQTVEFVDALPRTATGKILKRELRRAWVEDESAVSR